jgi:serine protease
MRRQIIVWMALATLLSTLFAGHTASAQNSQLRERVTFPKPEHTDVDPARSRDDVVVLKFHEGTRVRLANGAYSFDPARVTPEDAKLQARFNLSNATIKQEVAQINALIGGDPNLKSQKMFRRSAADLEKERLAGQTRAKEELSDLPLYSYITLKSPEGEAAEILIGMLNEFQSVEIAYPQPLVDVAVDLAPTTPSMVASQGYLNAAPSGIDARYAWTFPGGRGAGVRVVDVETAWTKDHEDFPALFWDGSGINVGNRDHGTAVVGVVAAPNNGYGVTGIASDSQMGVATSVRVSFWPIPDAINDGAAHLRRGDVLLIEHHAHGPSSGMACDDGNCDQWEYIAQEYWPADFDAIRNATARGIIVVEAAGNGGMNLDSPIYEGRFNRAVRDSGAILVGAGQSWDRAPWAWSNYGSRVDVFGWGDGVQTLGYGGTRINGDDQRQWYTMGFSGTSSASPIVVGAAATIQGIRLARGLAPLDPIAMRNLLRSTGTPQASSSRQIGTLPDLRRAIDSFIPPLMSGATFLHRATSPTISGNTTQLNSAIANGDASVLVFATSNYNPGGVGGRYNNHQTGVWYDAGARKWGVFNQDLATMPTNAAFNIQVLRPGANAFVQRATSSNISFNSTYIDHPSANGNPNALIWVTQSYNPGGAGGRYNNHAVGVWYDGSRGKWAVFNQDLAAMPASAAFNVKIPSASASRFMHRATAANIAGHATYIDNAQTNGNPNALLAVTQSYNPGGGGGVYNNHAIGVWYDTGAGKWAIFNQDLQTMPANAAFNVEVYPS